MMIFYEYGNKKHKLFNVLGRHCKSIETKSISWFRVFVLFNKYEAYTCTCTYPYTYIHIHIHISRINIFPRRERMNRIEHST